MASTGKRHKIGYGCQDFRNHPIGGVETIRTDELPHFVEVKAGLRVERISGHEPGCKPRAAALFSRK